jgi:PPP family 3-phenylpropionic acid transporter
VDQAAEETRDPPAFALGASYFANFGALAIYGPFLALYLQKRGFHAQTAAQLLAAMSLVRVVAAPGWTLLADKLQSTGLVLRIVSAGAALSFALLFAQASPLAVGLILLAFAVFRAPFGALIDTLTLRWSARTGRGFGEVRAWGTAGYTLGAFGAGAVVTRFGTGAITAATTVFLVLTAVLALTLPGGGRIAARPHLVRSLTVLIRRPRFVLLLATATLHEIGLAPYDSLFPSYMTEISSASYAGISVGVGAVAELVFMIVSASLARRIGPTRLLAIAYGTSVVRWATMALVTQPVVLIAVQMLHAFGFGAFYLSAVAIVDAESPPQVRASAQGVFAAWTFGVAGAIGLSLAGIVLRYASLRGVFAIASVTSGVAAIVALRMGSGVHSAGAPGSVTD